MEIEFCGHQRSTQAQKYFSPEIFMLYGTFSVRVKCENVFKIVCGWVTGFVNSKGRAGVGVVGVVGLPLLKSQHCCLASNKAYLCS